MLHRCERQANKRTGEKGKKTCSHTSSLRHSCSCASGTASSVCCAGVFTPWHITPKKNSFFSFFLCLLAINPLVSRSQPPALMIHSLSINQFFKLSNYPSPPSISLRSWIYKSEVPQVLNNQFCHFPSVCLKARRWTSLVKQTRVNNSHLNWQGQKSSEVARDENQKVNAEASAFSPFGFPSDRWQKLLLTPL